jgi:hypothetical protein
MKNDNLHWFTYYQRVPCEWGDERPSYSYFDMFFQPGN